MTELKPCPFCGSYKVAVVTNYLGQHYIICKGCNASIWVTHDIDNRSEKKTINAWNRRDQQCTS